MQQGPRVRGKETRREKRIKIKDREERSDKPVHR